MYVCMYGISISYLRNIDGMTVVPSHRAKFNKALVSRLHQVRMWLFFGPRRLRFSFSALFCVHQPIRMITTPDEAQIT